MYTQLKSISFRFFTRRFSIRELSIQKTFIQKLFMQSALLLATFATAQASGNFVIKGTAQGLPDQTITLIAVTGEKRGKRNTLAKAKLVNGKFELKGQLEDAPINTYLIFSDIRFLMDGRNKLFIEASDMSLSLEIEGMSKPTNIQDDKHYRINYKLKGASTHDEYIQLKNNLAPFDKKEDKNHYLIELIGKHPDQFKSLLALDEMLFSISLKKKKKLFASLSEKLKKSALGIHYITGVTHREQQQKMAAEMVEGQSFKDFTLNDVNGKSVKVSHLLKPRRYTLLKFDDLGGAQYSDIPGIYKKFHDKGFDVIAVSMGTALNDWLKMVKKEGMPWIHLRDPKFEVTDQYGVIRGGTNFLLDGNGKIIATHLDSFKLYEKLLELL